MSLLVVVGKVLLRKNIWKHSTNPDVQEPHNPCFCPRIDQIDIRPENKCYDGNYLIEQ